MEINEDYRATVEQIKTHDTSGQGPISANDASLIASTRSNGKNSDSEWSKRDKLYTRLLKKYISEYESKEKWKKWYKLAFFVVTLLSFIGIIAVSLASLFFVAIKENPSLVDIGTVLGSIAGIISALMVLPKIIANHLFPKNEDSNMINMVKNMQVNDNTGVGKDLE